MGGLSGEDTERSKPAGLPLSQFETRMCVLELMSKSTACFFLSTDAGMMACLKYYIPEFGYGITTLTCLRHGDPEDPKPGCSGPNAQATT